MKNEEKAIAIGDDPVALRSRLMDAKSMLIRVMHQQFGENTFDARNRRLVSNNGSYILQWLLRRRPDQPEGYDNQQTSCGIVVLLKAGPAEVAHGAAFPGRR